MGIFYQNELESHHAIEKQIQCLKMETVLEVVKTISKLVELIENGEMSESYVLFESFVSYDFVLYMLSQDYKNWYALV